MDKDIHRMSLWNKSTERSLFVQEDVEKDVTIINQLNYNFNLCKWKRWHIFAKAIFFNPSKTKKYVHLKYLIIIIIN